MSQLLAAVDSHTDLVGKNRLELLMFQLAGRQIFALNVFKIQEVLAVPPLVAMPQSHPVVKGVTHLRDRTISVIDLSAAIGKKPIADTEPSNMIVTEYNRTVQAFLVGRVDRIVNLNWEKILPPPRGAGTGHYLTAITHVDEQIVEILDVERILSDIIPYDTSVSNEVLDQDLVQLSQDKGLTILLVDDSTTAMKQAREILAKVGINSIMAKDGMKALKLLKKWIAEGIDPCEKLTMVITDAEMPEMDGYRLTHEIRNDPAMRGLFVALHTSLSGNFNKAMVKKVGCDTFLSKFQPDKLAEVVQQQARRKLGL